MLGGTTLKKTMKYILVLFIAVASTFGAHAQSSFSSQYGLNLDTATNTTPKSLFLGKTAGYFKTFITQFTATKISGTVGGTAQLQGSHNNTDWYSIGSPYTLTDVASQTTSFAVTDFGHLYIRVLVTPTGTMSAQVKASALGRK